MGGMGAKCCYPFAARAPSSRQTVEENEYDQPIIDRLAGQVRNEHIKTKDVKSEDGSFVIHSETRTFTGGSEDADPDEPTFSRDGTGELLLESNPWQWMVEKSQGEVGEVVADPKSSSVAEIESKKASLRARLEKLRAEEAEISKMLRDNEPEEDDDDYDGEA